MAKIPIKLLANGIKEHGPKVIKFTKENGKDVMKTVAVIGSSMGTINKITQKRKEKNLNKVHYRKAKFNEYKTAILKDLDTKKRHELFHYTLEIKQFINQINNEETNTLAIKKSLHARREKNWIAILTQIQDKITIKDYEEYLKIYHSENYHSEYFLGFEGHVEEFKILLSNEKSERVYAYLAEQTNKSVREIKRDFIGL
ncbi:hypothetical protein [Priestia aryabhattai]|uniref:hypothetical protein n=1 Tax=Priestia aryabhattai TaxID=412384 RepID=UPI001C8D705A|nr:hypothetical protein [Priestia aryabhattai]MBX9996068.1 hypothetical protein [Priestia aryabhattai]